MHQGFLVPHVLAPADQVLLPRTTAFCLLARRFPDSPAVARPDLLTPRPAGPTQVPSLNPVCVQSGDRLFWYKAGRLFPETQIKNREIKHRAAPIPEMPISIEKKTPVGQIELLVLNRDNPSKANAMTSIAIIVPVRNESRFIRRTLEALVNQLYPADKIEILVIDGQSTDGTPEIVDQMAAVNVRLRRIDNPRRWSSAARNLGVQWSNGEIILVVDGHCELTDRHYMEKLVTAFEKSNADCVGRPQPQEVSGASPLQQAIAAARSSPIGHHPDSHIYSDKEGFVPAISVAVAYRRSVFDKVGLFDESFDACEDVELNYRIDRAGLKCFFAPEIRLPYEPRSTLGGLFRQLVRYGRGRMRLLRKHPETWSLKTLVPALFVVGLFVGLLGSFFFPWCAWIYAATMLIYFLIIAAASIHASKNVSSWQAAFWLPVILVLIHIASGWGQLIELLRPVRRNPYKT